jgi:hypothetical protein
MAAIVINGGILAASSLLILVFCCHPIRSPHRNY